MKLAFQLAFKNLMGAGLRTWLNVSVLAFTFIIIVFFNGLYNGWNDQAKNESIAWEYGEGQLLNEDYDPYDPFSIKEGHAVAPVNKNLEPILIQQASIYPEGRMINILCKGIDPNQQTLELPAYALDINGDFIPAIIGEKMSKASGLKKGDEVLMRWRDENGTFDASQIKIVNTFKTNVPSVDHAQVWIPLEKLREITGLEGHATYLVANQKYNNQQVDGWKWVSQKELLQSITDLINSKRAGGAFMYILLLAIALLALFDTQVLSIFRRQKEIGTYIAMGMTRWDVLKLFTVEGAMYSMLAAVVGTVIGFPLMYFFGNKGIPMPASNQDIGIAMAERMYPSYGLTLFLGTIILLVISATIVSFLPSRKIVKMNPVDALKGKIQ